MIRLLAETDRLAIHVDLATSRPHTVRSGARCDSQPFRSRANSLPGANRPIKPWPIRSLELTLPGAKWPWNFRSVSPWRRYAIF